MTEVERLRALLSRWLDSTGSNMFAFERQQLIKDTKEELDGQTPLPSVVGGSS